MNDVIADTHGLIWYLSGDSKLSTTAREAFDNTLNGKFSIFFSAISLVEALYLVEKNRIPSIALSRLYELIEDSNSGINLVPVNIEIVKLMQAIPREVVPEMPDRIIAATALHLGCPLVTRDTKIQASEVNTIW